MLASNSLLASWDPQNQGLSRQKIMSYIITWSLNHRSMLLQSPTTVILVSTFSGWKDKNKNGILFLALAGNYTLQRQFSRIFKAHTAAECGKCQRTYAGASFAGMAWVNAGRWWEHLVRLDPLKSTADGTHFCGQKSAPDKSAKGWKIWKHRGISKIPMMFPGWRWWWSRVFWNIRAQQALVHIFTLRRQNPWIWASARLFMLVLRVQALQPSAVERGCRRSKIEVVPRPLSTGCRVQSAQMKKQTLREARAVWTKCGPGR